MADNADFVPQKLSRKQTMEMQAKHMEELQKSDPDTDFKVDEEWWAPGINLAFDVKETLNQEASDKLDAICQRAIDQKFSPESVTAALDEAKVCLAGHDDLLERFTAIFSQLQNNQGSGSQEVAED